MAIIGPLDHSQKKSCSESSVPANQDYWHVCLMPCHAVHAWMTDHAADPEFIGLHMMNMNNRASRAIHPPPLLRRDQILA